jgi:site-specific DNA recombinase
MIAPREEWIEIPVTALVTEEAFTLAQEQLQTNKRFASRPTIRPALLQNLLVCQQCGYALSGASGGRKPYRKLYCYRCVGSDRWRHLQDPVCQNLPVRQDYFDELIWQEILHLSREQSRLQNKIDRLLTAYQEELITLEQLRQRMPKLRKPEQAVRSELQSLHMAAQDQSRYLRIVDSLADFRTQLQNNADRLDVIGRRKIIRLLVKEILVGTDTITVRHSIPLASSTPRPTDPVPPPARPPQPSASGDYLLCTRRNRATSGA